MRIRRAAGAPHARRGDHAPDAGHLAAFLALALLLATVVLGFPGPAGAGEAGARAGGPVRVEAVEVELVSRESAVVPGRPLTLGLRLLHDPGWHTYWRNPGDSGLPTQLDLSVPSGFVAGEIQWPAPQRQFIAPLANYGYEGEIVLPLPVVVPDPIPKGDGSPVRFSGKASWLMCREVCIPGEAQVSLLLPVIAEGAAVPPTTHAGLFDAARERTPHASLDVRVAAAGDLLSIGLAQPLESAEFFPYQEGLVANAEPQVLYALDGQGQSVRRLEIRLSAEGAKAAATDPGALLKAAEGVLVTADDVFELRPTTTGAAPAGGAEIARVAGAPPAGSVLAGSTGTRLPGLTGAGRGSGTTLAIGTPAAKDAIGGAAGESPRRLSGLLAAALFAAIGGLILNLMPCVFPVIGLKVLGFARHGGGGDAAQARAARTASRHGAFAFSAGVIVSFWLLAALLLVLRVAGQAAGWGFQLQSPVFVAAMALLFVAIALNFSGVWEIGIAMTRLGRYDPALHAGEVGHRSSFAASFGSGVLAVLVATPCTAPFMGSALGFTLGATALEAFTVFTALGFGMALPYLLLGAFPGWLRWLPRPGRWMESFRQALAFPMYATAAWLAWVLGQQAGIDAVFGLSIGALLLALAAWLYGRFIQRAPIARTDPSQALRHRVVAALLAVVALAAGLRIAWPSAALVPGATSLSAETEASQASGAAAWHSWSADALAQARAEGRPVFIDFTAAWCVSCQVNKQLVLDRAPVVEAMARAGVLRLRADWTRRDPAIGAELARHGRNGVPLYLLFGPGGTQPVVLPELLTGGIVLDALAALPAWH